MKNHIQILLDAEKQSNCSLMWNRINDNTIVFSTTGYHHAEHALLEEKLIKAGCNYAFHTNRPIQSFDRQCGRTFTYIKEPKKGDK